MCHKDLKGGLETGQARVMVSIRMTVARASFLHKRDHQQREVAAEMVEDVGDIDLDTSLTQAWEDRPKHGNIRW